VWFSCLGTTLKAAGSKDKQWKIDYEIPLKFAGIAKENGVRGIVLLSAYGASAKSRVFYSKMKGQLEEAITHLAFEQCIIFKPGMLLRKNTDRFAERITAGILKFFNSLGLIRKIPPDCNVFVSRKISEGSKNFIKRASRD